MLFVGKGVKLQPWSAVIGPSATEASDVLSSVRAGNQMQVVWRPHGLQPNHRAAELHSVLADDGFPAAYYFSSRLSERRTDYANTHFRKFSLLPDSLQLCSSSFSSCCCCCLSVSRTLFDCLSPLYWLPQPSERCKPVAWDRVRGPTKEFRKCYERKVVLVSPCKHSEAWKGISLLSFWFCLSVCVLNVSAVQQQNNTIHTNQHLIISLSFNKQAFKDELNVIFFQFKCPTLKSSLISVFFQISQPIASFLFSIFFSF